MEPEVNDRSVRAIEIEFQSGTRARAVLDAKRLSVESLLQALGLADPRPVLLVVGGADALDRSIESTLESLLEGGAIRAAEHSRATILDGGTASGVMAVVGRASAASDASVPLVGVAPAGKVTYPNDDRGIAGARTQLDANHTHFVLADGDQWGGETTLLFDVLDTLGLAQPVAVLLAGGGDIAMEEVRLAARRGLPIVVLTGTGGTADDLALAAAMDSAPTGQGVDTIAEIAAEADLTFLPLTSDPANLERVLTRFLKVDETLAEAWRQQKLVSAAAGRQQGDFRFGQSTLLVLGLLVTYLVVAKSVLDKAGILERNPLLGTVLYFVILLIPISVGVLAGAASRMRPGGRWVLLRGTSESLKREIFRYRARAGIYSHEQTRKVSREVKLAQAVGSAMGGLMRTDVNLLALDAPKPRRRWSPRTWLKLKEEAAALPQAPVDKPLAPLTPAGYITHRIDKQVAWYRDRIPELERHARWLRWFALGFGGAGTLLAAVGLEIWVAVTTSLVGIYSTILEAWQLESSIALYNQASTDLTAIRTWWFALPPAEQERQKNIDRLVEQAERIMRAEHVGWVQEMQDAMTQLRLEQAAEKTSGTDSKEPVEDEDAAG